MSLELRHGMCFWPWQRASRQSASAERLRLMLCASRRWPPVAWLCDTRSLLARSVNHNLDTVSTPCKARGRTCHVSGSCQLLVLVAPRLGSWIQAFNAFDGPRFHNESFHERRHSHGINAHDACGSGCTRSWLCNAKETRERIVCCDRPVLNGVNRLNGGCICAYPHERRSRWLAASQLPEAA